MTPSVRPEGEPIPLYPSCPRCNGDGEEPGAPVSIHEIALCSLCKGTGEAPAFLVGWRVGDRVYWHDPEDGLCSGPGTITSIQGAEDGDPLDEDAIIALAQDDGGEVEALPHELKKLEES